MQAIDRRALSEDPRLADVLAIDDHIPRATSPVGHNGNIVNYIGPAMFQNDRIQSRLHLPSAVIES